MTNFTIRRSINISAPRERVHALVNAFPEWEKWSPFEDLDPDLKRHYSGADAGAGARYEWEGNKRAGAGRMTITSSDLGTITIDLEFLKPRMGKNPTTFTFESVGEHTVATWTMSGTYTGIFRILAKVFKIQRELENEFDRGLAQLKAVAEVA